MKKLFKNVLTSIALVGAMVTINSCQKENIEKTEVKKPVQTVNEHAVQLLPQAADMGNRMLNLITFVINPNNHVFKNQDEILSFDSVCAVITTDSSSYPYVATLDFGTTGCYDSKGKLYKGKVIITYTNRDIYAAGTNIQIEYQNFEENGIFANGTGSFVNNGTNVDGNMEIETTINFNLTVDGFEYNGDLNLGLELVSGTETRIKGSLTATATTGETYEQTVDVSAPLVKLDGCEDDYVSGIVTTKKTGSFDSELNYGGGSCDNTGAVTENGVRTTVHFY